MRNRIMSNSLNQNYVLIFILVLLVVFTFQQSLDAQQDLKKRVFTATDNLFTQAKGEQADLLSPDNFRKATEKYEAASSDFDKGKNVSKKLDEINELVRAAIDNAKLGQVTFSHLMVARDEAIEANAIEFAKESFEKAEELFNDATRTLEKGSVNKAKEKSIRSEQLFREAELLAIKVSIIGNVKKQLAEAEEKKVSKLAPITIKHAQDLLSEAESILQSDRSAKSDAKEKAELAEYEVNHATYFANQIKTLKKEELNWEKLYLEHEKYFAQVLNELGFAPRFESGFENPTQTAIKAIASLKNQNKELSSEITKLDQKIEKVEEEKNVLQNELATVKEKEAGLRTKLTLEEKRQEKFKKIESLFSTNEAKVIREGDQIKIRLLGLNFASGKAVIDPEYFGMLTKLQRAIRIFPDYHLTIEGHTDNKGDSRSNQSLSLRRARSVMSYLIANMGLTESQISAIGYGESQPIASNETEQGRAQNRRIDVILQPPSN